MRREELKAKSVKAQKGITLIALVITIIVLLILAGVTINLTLGQNGIFKTAEQAAKNYKEAENKELGLLNEFNEELSEITDFNKLKQFDGTVNKPITEGTGLIPVTINADGSLKIVEETDASWYDYVDTSIEGKQTTSKWANAKTADNSMWVWIPRYAYKITYTDANDKSKGGTIDVVFLKGITNLDANGNDVTKEGYIVHPAFRDGRRNGYANGEWDSEITGFWVAKFEAGYQEAATAKNSTVKLSTIYQWNGTTNENLTTNYYGNRAVGDLIKYPVFQANRPSMNNLSIADAYDLSMSLVATDNPYELKNVDSHLMKNSEWGAVAYLTHSKYGRNGSEITINNVSVNNENTIYAVTGYGASSVSAAEDKTRTLATLITSGQTGNWTTPQGQLASSTGNIYGIYDLSGGLWEWTAGYIAPTSGNYQTYGGNLKGESNKYKSKYAGTSGTNQTNYETEPNPSRLGEAIWETSTSGAEGSKTSWNGDYSCFWYASAPFSLRGGRWHQGTYAGVFAFYRSGGHCYCHVGFRPVLVAE